MQSILSFVARIALACAFMGVVGCATKGSIGSIGSISISSTPSSANVEIRSVDGTVVEQGQTPMTANLEHGKDYTVNISLAGYQTQTIPVKSSFDYKRAEFCAEFCLTLSCSMLSAAIFDEDFDVDDLDSMSTDPEWKFEPGTIIVQLEDVTTLDGSDTAIYAFLTIVYEDGKHQHATVEMTPASAN